MKKLLTRFLLLSVSLAASKGFTVTLAEYESKIRFSKNTDRMILVENKGSFIMGSKQSANLPGSTHNGADELPWRHIVVDSFYIDQYESTASEVTEFLAQRGIPHLNLSANNTDPSKQAFNIGPWSLAEEYCRYKGKRLATEAEWEKAAQAGQNLAYSTSNGKIDTSLANIFRPKEEGVGLIGQYPPNPMGIYDMTGNASEWVLDWYYADGYFSCAGGLKQGKYCYNPVALDFPKKDILPRKVHRGGHYAVEVAYAFLTSYRGCIQPELAWGNTGVRCVLPAKYTH